MGTKLKQQYTQGVSKRFVQNNKGDFTHPDEQYLPWNLRLHSILISGKTMMAQRSGFQNSGLSVRISANHSSVQQKRATSKHTRKQKSSLLT